MQHAGDTLPNAILHMHKDRITHLVLVALCHGQTTSAQLDISKSLSAVQSCFHHLRSTAVRNHKAGAGLSSADMALGLTLATGEKRPHSTMRKKRQEMAKYPQRYWLMASAPNSPRTIMAISAKMILQKTKQAPTQLQIDTSAIDSLI